MKRVDPKRRINRGGDRERRSFRKDLRPADTEFEDAIADLQRAWRQPPTLLGRRSRSERLAWQHLIEVCRSKRAVPD